MRRSDSHHGCGGGKNIIALAAEVFAQTPIVHCHISTESSTTPCAKELIFVTKIFLSGPCLGVGLSTN